MSTRYISWRVKAAGAEGWQLDHLYAAIVWKSENLNLLEPSGPVQACTRIALPLDICEMCTKLEILYIFIYLFIFFKKLFDLREYSCHSQISVAFFTEGCASDMLLLASGTVHFARVFEHNF
jgi:hypothetical protein